MYRKYAAHITLALSVFIALAIIAGGCIQPEGTQKTMQPKKNITNENVSKNATKEETVIIAGPCEGRTNEEVDLCLLNLSMCSQIKSISLRDECYYNLANCTEILNKSLRDECMLKQKLTECEKQDNINLCKALAANDPIYCGVNENCIFSYSYEKGDDSACAKLNDYDYKEYACKAIAQANFHICYELMYEASQKECLKLYAKTTGVDGNICSKISYDEYKEDCYKGVAENTLDYTNCLLISTYKTHKECISNVARDTANATICEKLRKFYTDKEWQEDIDFCKTMVAQVNYKPQICQELMNTGYRSGCFGGSIVDGKVSKEDCDMIDSNEYPEWSAECYKRAAK